MFRIDRNNRPGGDLIFLIRKSVNYTVIHNLCNISDNLETGAIKILDESPEFVLAGCYRVPGFNVSQSEWDQYFNSINSQGPCLIFGDFNSHNIHWNCSHTDTNGKKILNSVSDSDLTLINENTLTHIDFSRDKLSNIDLVFSSPTILDKIKLPVIEDTWNSDHYPLSVKLSTEKVLYSKKSSRLTSRKTDWSLYQSTLDKNYINFLQPEYSNLSTTNKYYFFCNTLIDAVSESTPAKKPPSYIHHRNPVSWWDSECARLIRLRKAAFKKWRFSHNPTDLLEYKKRKAAARKYIKKRKVDDFRSFAESINFNTDTSYVWNKCRILKNKWTNINHINSEPANRITKIIEAINKVSPSWVPTNPNNQPPNLNENNQFPATIFSLQELNLAINNSNFKSSPGPDNIEHSLISFLPFKTKLLLLDLYNEIYQLSEFPPPWKESITFFIGKKDNSSVRPISLTSCLCKIFEKMIKLRLQWWLESIKFFPSSQAGFRPGRSCSDNLSFLNLTVEEAFYKKEDVLACFLDVKGAFDNILPDILSEKLRKLNCPSNIIKFVNFLTYERNVTFILSPDSSIKRKIYKGVPQGGVLSPLLYLIYVESLGKNLDNNIHILQFADDIAILTRSIIPRIGKKSIEKAVAQVNNNLNMLGLSLAPEKTKLVHFNKKSIPPGSCRIKIENHIIASSPRANFLGIILDYQLTFDDHIQFIRNKCLQRLNILKFVSGIRWGADPLTLTILYKKA